MKRVFKYTDVWGTGQARWTMPNRDDLDALTVGDLIEFQGRTWTVISIDVSRNLLQLEN